MSKFNVKLLKNFFQSKKDIGENGFWVDKNIIASSGTDTEMSDSGQKLEKIKKEVLSCKKCPLGQHRLNACFGNGNYKTDLMFVGEGPGYDEDHQGKVFVGRAGRLLDSILNKAFNLTRLKVYITNIVKCHPMKDSSNPEKRGNDRPPTDKEIQICLPYLIQQINLIKPKVLITLGSPASKTLLNTDRGITSIRGKVFDMKFGNISVKVVPTFHPAYLLRDPSKKKEVLEDTKLIRSLL